MSYPTGCITFCSGQVNDKSVHPSSCNQTYNRHLQFLFHPCPFISRLLTLRSEVFCNSSFSEVRVWEMYIYIVFFWVWSFTYGGLHSSRGCLLLALPQDSSNMGSEISGNFIYRPPKQRWTITGVWLSSQSKILIYSTYLQIVYIPLCVLHLYEILEFSTVWFRILDPRMMSPRDDITLVSLCPPSVHHRACCISPMPFKFEHMVIMIGINHITFLIIQMLLKSALNSRISYRLY